MVANPQSVIELVLDSAAFYPLSQALGIMCILHNLERLPAFASTSSSKSTGSPRTQASHYLLDYKIWTGVLGLSLGTAGGTGATCCRCLPPVCSEVLTELGTALRHLMIPHLHILGQEMLGLNSTFRIKGIPLFDLRTVTPPIVGKATPASILQT